MTMAWWVILIILLGGAAGGFVNAFIGDSGLHLPVVENGIFRPGFIGIVFIGMMAALASWGAAKAAVIAGSSASSLSLSTSDIASAILTGFGGAKWFKSEIEKQILRKTASIAAAKDADPQAASSIASSTPAEALQTAVNMH
jgi:hypothetical protein